MTLLVSPTIGTVPRKQCAEQLLDIVPLMMRAIRAQVRSRGGGGLSLPQFRALAFLGRNESAMLGDVGEFLGLTLPAASKLIEGLVAAGMVSRRADPVDRRKVMLRLTAAGRRSRPLRLAQGLRLAGPGLACRRAFGPMRRAAHPSAWPSQISGTRDSAQLRAIGGSTGCPDWSNLTPT